MNITKISDQDLDVKIFETRITLQCTFEEKKYEEVRLALNAFLLERNRRKITKLDIK